MFSIWFFLNLILDCTRSGWPLPSTVTSTRYNVQVEWRVDKSRFANTIFLNKRTYKTDTSTNPALRGVRVYGGWTKRRVECDNDCTPLLNFSVKGPPHSFLCTIDLLHSRNNLFNDNRNNLFNTTYISNLYKYMAYNDVFCSCCRSFDKSVQPFVLLSLFNTF